MLRFSGGCVVSGLQTREAEAESETEAKLLNSQVGARHPSKVQVSTGSGPGWRVRAVGHGRGRGHVPQRPGQVGAVHKQMATGGGKHKYARRALHTNKGAGPGWRVRGYCSPETGYQNGSQEQHDP